MGEFDTAMTPLNTATVASVLTAKGFIACPDGIPDAPSEGWICFCNAFFAYLSPGNPPC